MASRHLETLSSAGAFLVALPARRRHLMTAGHSEQEGTCASPGAEFEFDVINRDGVGKHDVVLQSKPLTLERLVFRPRSVQVSQEKEGDTSTIGG